MGEHYHPYSEEFLYVTRGTATVRLDGSPIEVGAGSGILIPRNVRHRVQNDGDGVVDVVFQLCPLAPRPELGHVNTEPLPDDRA
jgi:quercetin dioxygenase-like cupin family protein